MNTQQLRNSILQSAMQGEIVDQNLNNESAANLLKEIRDLKNLLIEKKIIKRVDSLPVKDKDIPSIIPENWEWVRLGDVAQVKGGKRVPKGYKLSDLQTPYVYLRVADMKEHTISFANLKYVEEEVFQKINNYTINTSDLYLTIAGTIGKVGSIPHFLDGALLTENAVKITPYLIDLDFLLILLDSPLVQMQFENLVNKVAQPKLSIRSINSTLIPLPPLEEQKRIVNKIRIVEERIESYGKLYTALENTQTIFPVKLEKSVLQYAMQGKLVSQCTKDEPASILIKKIKSEKEEQVKRKIIKKELALHQITEEEIPFEIPETWEWVRLGEIIQLTSGRDLTTSEYNDSNNGIPYITGASNFHKGELNIVRWTSSPRVVTKEGDLLITCKGTIGEMAIQNLPEAHIARQVMALRMIKSTSTEYIQLCLQFLLNELKNSAKSMIPGISREDILNLKIPFPPIEEQYRIVVKVEELSIIIQKLSKEHLEVIQKKYSLII